MPRQPLPRQPRLSKYRRGERSIERVVVVVVCLSHAHLFTVQLHNLFGLSLVFRMQAALQQMAVAAANNAAGSAATGTYRQEGALPWKSMYTQSLLSWPRFVVSS